MSKPLLGPRFEEALTLAARLHATQTKKGTKVPYIAHLFGVASLVLEDGGDEDQAIAALLHDSIEDQGLTEAEIEERFGPRVREIVVACTDAFEHPKPPWRPRKEAYLAHLAEASPEVLRVSAADKLHNARADCSDPAPQGEPAPARCLACPTPRAHSLPHRRHQPGLRRSESMMRLALAPITEPVRKYPVPAHPT